MSLSVRWAGIEDIPLIRELAGVVFPHTYKEIITPAQIEYMMEMMYSQESLTEQMTVLNHQYFVAEYDGSPAGYVSISPEGDSLYHLQKIYVLPTFQGLGIGKALFLRAEEFVCSNASGKARIELNVNRENKAISFYEHMGMAISRQGDFPIGNGFFMNDYIMAKDYLTT